MAEKNDGGPAFPRSGRPTVEFENGSFEEGVGPFNGMSLRDYFAGQALVGIMIAQTAAALRGMESASKLTAERNANRAYDHADAMLAAREKPDG